MDRDWESLATQRGVPSHTAMALDRYLRHGVPTGSFLRAFLANDLMEAMGRADEDNASSFKQIAGFVYMDMPSTSHGSYEQVDAWLKMKAQQRADDVNG